MFLCVCVRVCVFVRIYMFDPTSGKRLDHPYACENKLNKEDRAEDTQTHAHPNRHACTHTQAFLVPYNSHVNEEGSFLSSDHVICGELGHSICKFACFHASIRVNHVLLEATLSFLLGKNTSDSHQADKQIIYS